MSSGRHMFSRNYGRCHLFPYSIVIMHSGKGRRSGRGGLDRGLAYWEKTLEGMPQYLSLSTGSGDGGQGGSKRVPVEVSRDLFGRVQRYAF